MGQKNQVQLCKTCEASNAVNDQYCWNCGGLLEVEQTRGGGDSSQSGPKPGGRFLQKITTRWDMLPPWIRIVTLAVIFSLVLSSILLYVFNPFAKAPPLTCASGTIAVEGSTALQPLGSQAAQSYHTMCPQATVNVRATSSEAGLRQVAAGEIQIGNSDLRSSNKDLVDHPIAVVIYVLILNRDVANITNLTSAQIQGIYNDNGSITCWDQVGGPKSPITVVSRTSTSGTRQTFEQYVLQGPEKLPTGSTHIEVDTTEIMANTVANTSGAIGYVDLGTAIKQQLQTVPVDGAQAVQSNIENGRYTFWTVAHMYTKGNPSGLTKAFLEYMTGKEVEGTIKDLHYVPINNLSPDVIKKHPGPTALGL